MKKLCIVTSTRAEYGLMKNLIRLCFDEEELDVRLIVTGTHLSHEYGYTCEEIVNDGLVIDSKLDILSSDNTSIGIANTMANGLSTFAEYFTAHKPDMLLVLGDRYEIMAVCIAAMLSNIPIAHIHGGETTEGAIDESIRHSITKMSYIHFTSTDRYMKRVIQLGENPSRVFNVGALGVQNIKKEVLYSKTELEAALNINLHKPYAVVTYHPETIGNSFIEMNIISLLHALDSNLQMSYIITKANADCGGKDINRLLEKYAQNRNDVYLFSSLGMKNYLSALKYATMVIGNSSSGIIEAPSFHIPTVNIGNRQKGRIQAQSIINCDESTESIVKAINIAKKMIDEGLLSQVTNPYEGTDTAKKILYQIKKYINNDNISLQKKFYDMGDS